MRIVVLGIALLLSGLPAHAVARELVPPESGLYYVWPDLRMCPSPICGGAWVQRINHTMTLCADGTSREACYVAEISFRSRERAEAAALVPPFASRMVLRGVIGPREYPGLGNLGGFRATAAWEAAADPTASSPVYLVRDNGIRCITFPCFSYDGRLINTAESLTFSGVDLAAVDATPAERAAAQAALNGPGLLVAGQISNQPGPAGDGRVLVANQFYLPTHGARPGPSPRPAEHVQRTPR